MHLSLISRKYNVHYRNMLLFPGPFYVIVEHCGLGSLRAYLRQCRLSDDTEGHSNTDQAKHLTSKDLLSFAWQISKGMEYLAERKVPFSLLVVLLACKGLFNFN